MNVSKFKIEVLNNSRLNLDIMMFFLVIFYWSAMGAYGHSKREVLEIFNINKNNGIGRLLFWNRQPIGQ